MGGDDGWRRGERAGAVAFSTVVLGAVLSPLLQYRRPMAERVDGFPLSWYPMFSAKRRRRAWVTYAVGLDAAGERHHLPCEALGPGGINQVRRQLYRVAVREGQPQRYAAGLAERVLRHRDCGDVVVVQVVRSRFDLDRCFLDRRLDGELRVLATAAVRRPAPVVPR